MSNLDAQEIIGAIKVEGACRVRLQMSQSTWLDHAALEQLKSVARLQGMHTVVGMPDLHPGKGQPIGAAFISRDIVYPHLVGSDIGCGMSLWQLDIQRNKVKLDKWMQKLESLGDEDTQSPDKTLPGTGGCDGCFTQHKGKLGTIGGGNHFAELQCVDRIYDEQVFVDAGLRSQAVLMLVHSGSRGIGQQILHEHVAAFGSAGIGGGALDSYLQKHDFADRWAQRNRYAIAERFLAALRVDGRCVLDLSHNHVRRLSTSELAALGCVGDDSDNMWIHRKGATLVAEGLAMIPGSRGSLSYLVQPRTTDAGVLASGGFSLAHGAGRKWKRSDCKGRLQARFKAKDLETTSFGSRVICKQRDLLYEEAPQAYKDIDQVISDLVATGMIDVIATFKPLITYKTTRK